VGALKATIVVLSRSRNLQELLKKSFNTYTCSFGEVVITYRDTWVQNVSTRYAGEDDRGPTLAYGW
jgi:hypothetical protein